MGDFSNSCSVVTPRSFQSIAVDDLTTINGRANEVSKLLQLSIDALGALR